MNKECWLARVKKHQEKLRDFVDGYHPASSSINKPPLPITAPNAEQLCKVIRNKIRQETKVKPVDSFDKALKESNCDELNSLLTSAWFGVPESTSCWSISGFREAVSLLEDPPDWS